MPARTPDDQNDTRQGEPGTYPDENPTYERDISLESELAEFDWEGYFDMMNDEKQCNCGWVRDGGACRQATKGRKVDKDSEF